MADTYLTEEELQREVNLFAPSEVEYKSLEGKAYDIYSFKEEVSNDVSSAPPPPSCQARKTNIANKRTGIGQAKYPGSFKQE